eukprot:31162-Pelagococcus_subviridis.AAC.4
MERPADHPAVADAKVHAPGAPVPGEGLARGGLAGELGPVRGRSMRTEPGEDAGVQEHDVARKEKKRKKLRGLNPEEDGDADGDGGGDGPDLGIENEESDSEDDVDEEEDPFAVLQASGEVDASGKKVKNKSKTKARSPHAGPRATASAR